MAYQAPNPFPIKTVVVLVQENRSFDHMLGWMKSLNPDIDGFTGTESNPVHKPGQLSAERLYVHNNSGFIQPDPSHTFESIYQQVYNKTWPDTDTGTDTENTVPNMLGFAQNAETVKPGLSEIVMGGYVPDAVPVYKELVSEFAVCDRWFSSIPTLTQPNRLFVHSATSYGATTNDNKMMVEGYPQKTIFDSLDEAGLSFGIYYEYPPSTLFYRSLRKLKYVDKFHQFELHFKRHCEEGKLPNYVVIEQRYFETKLVPGNDDHPPHDISEGQKFVKKVYETLRSSPQWNELLFVIVYDEHGGFYDHVPTPHVGIPSPDGIVGPEPYKFQFDRLGVRVPAILISPWIERGTLLHRPSGPYSTSEYEHSSIAATLKKIFNLEEFLTKRDAWAGTFDCVVNRTSPRTDCPVTLPEPVKMREGEPDEQASLSEFQQEQVQLAAILSGDHQKSGHPDKLVENMTVSEAVIYMGKAFKRYRDECERAKRNGEDEDYIVSFSDATQRKSSESLTQKLLSCLVCDN